MDQGQQRLFDDYRYFFYMTNDWETPADRDRLRGQRPLQSGEPDRPTQGRRYALTAPVDNLVSNWAYMVMTAGLEPQGLVALWDGEGPGKRQSIKKKSRRC